MAAQGSHLRRAFARRRRRSSRTAASRSISSRSSARTRTSSPKIIGNYDGLAIRSATKVTAKILENAAKNLKVIGRAGIGVDNVDIPAATAARHHRDEHAVRQFDHHRRARDHADAGAGARRFPQADASTQAGKWEKNRFMGVEITGKTLGIIGCGNIGSIVADRAHRPEDEGDRLRSVPVAGARASISASRRSSSTSCSRRADFITLHTPLTDKTRNIIDAAAIAKMKKGVRIINCARGGLVDEEALRAALDSRPGRRRRLRRVRRGAGDSEPAVRPSQRRLHAASRRLDHGGAGERRAAGRRADVGLSADAARSPTPSTSPRSPPRKRRSSSRSSRSPKSSARSPASSPRPASARCRSSYEGAVAQMNTKALTSAALAGLLRPMLQDVNVVSAPVVAKERGIVVEEITPRGGGRLREPDHAHGHDRAADALVAGTVFADGRPRIVNIKGIRMDAEFGAVDALRHQPRQAGLHRPLRARSWRAPASTSPPSIVGREAPGGNAIALIEIDGEVPRRRARAGARNPNVQRCNR